MGLIVKIKRNMKMPDSLHPMTIAKCGMNCNLCDHYLSEKKSCAGCQSLCNKPKGCGNCEIVLCATSRGLAYCYGCDDFPCKSIKSLDSTYSEKYNISPIENSIQIRDFGMEYFLKTEKKR